MGFGFGYRNINLPKWRSIFWNEGGNQSYNENGPSAGAGDPETSVDSSGLGIIELIGQDAAGRHRLFNSFTNPLRTPIQFLIQPDASEVSQAFFVNGNFSAFPTLGNYSEAVQITRIDCIFSTANGAALTGTVTKEGTGMAPGTGAAIQVGSFNLNATANTLQTATLPTGVGTGNPLIVMQAGEQLSFSFSGAATSLAGLAVIVWFKPFVGLAPANIALNANSAIATRTMYLNIIPGLTISGVSMRWSAASTGTGTLTVSKDVSTNAPGAGTAILAAVVTPTSAANTTIFPALTATTATLTMAAGDRLALVLSGSVTALAGLVVTITFSNGVEFCHVIQNSQLLNEGVNDTFFISDHYYAVEDAWATWGTVSTSLTALITRDSGTTAPGAGTGLFSDNTNAGFLTSGTINTPVEGTLVTNKTSVILQPGDRLGMDYAGTLGTLANLCVAVRLRKL